MLTGAGATGLASLAGCSRMFGGSENEDDNTLELLTTYTSPAAKESYQAANEEFTQNNDYEPEMGYSNWSAIFDQLINASRTDEWPDLAFFIDNHWNALLYGQDLVEDPAELMDPAIEVAGDIRDGVPDTHYANKDGSYYTMMSNNQTEQFWYRTDLLEEIDEDPPENWEEEERVVRKLGEMDNDIYGTALSTARDVYTDNIFSGRQHGAGGFLVDPEQNPVLDSQATIDALEHWARLTEHAPPGKENFSFDDIYTNFATLKTASCYYWGRTLINVVEQSPDRQDDVSATHFPVPDTDSAQPNNRVLMSGDGGQLPSGAQNKEGAIAWWKNYMQPEYFVDIFMSGVPGNTAPIFENHIEPWNNFDIWTEVEHGEEIRDMLLADANMSHPYPRESPDHSLFPEAGNLIGNNVYSASASEYWSGDINAEEAAAEMQKRAEQELS